MMVIKEDNFIIFLINSLKEVLLLMNQIIKWKMNFINQLLEKLKTKNVDSFFRDNIWGVDSANMQSLSKYNKGIKYLLCN